MTRVLLLLVVLAPVAARAQSTTGDESGYAVALAVHAIPAIAFDILVARSLFADGTVRKGFAVNTVVFGGIATLLGSALALTLITDTRVKPVWGSLSVGLGVIGAATVVLGIYGLLHLALEEPKLYPGEAPIMSPSGNPPPQLRVLPLIGVAEGGGVVFGIGGAL